jgi:hypothetical protein
MLTPFYNKTIACTEKLYSARKKPAAFQHKKAAVLAALIRQHKKCFRETA